MAKVKIQVTREGLEEALEDSGDFVLPPKGYYHVRIEEVTPGFKKDASKSGGLDKTKPNLKVQYKIVGVGRDGEKPTENFGHIFDYISFSEASQFKREEFIAALGLTIPGKAKSKSFEIEIEEGKPGSVVGEVVLARLKHESQEGYDDSAKIAKLLPLPDGSATPGAFDDDENETTDDAPEDDPFSGEDSDEDEPDEDEPEDEDLDPDELLTLEDLEAMTPKELAETANEFDVDISSFTGTGRSAAAKKKNRMEQVMNAILEAQGGDPEDDDGDDEDPF